MSQFHLTVRRKYLFAGLIVISLFVIPTVLLKFTRGVSAQQQSGDHPAIPQPTPGTVYRQTNLISDIPGFAPLLDPVLINPWGITVKGTSPFWISNNGTRTTQLVKGDVSGAPVVLNANPQTINLPGNSPTGVVATSNNTDFLIPPPGGGSPAASLFIFDSITGNILAWNGAQGTTAQNVVSNPGHVYTGLAIGSNGGARLYAADFANNHIDVFDGTFAPSSTELFLDPTVPAAYHVFNIQNLGGALYVTYAKVDPSTNQSLDAAGEGFVRRFNTAGVRDVTFGINNGGPLNSPWGITIAPAAFGIFGGALLVGNFADIGNINAFNPTTGAFLGNLKDESNNPIVIDQLWALQFGNGGSGGDVNTLYFTAGIGEEEHGLFGKLNPTTATATSLIQFASSTFAVDEAGGHVDFSVIRTGNSSGTATVNFDTLDESQAGHASQKSDYEISLGKITFNPGETLKTFRILIVDDNFVEGDEVIDLALSNPTGTGVGLGSPSTAQLTILDNDTVASTNNPIDTASFFVRQNYLDFLNREPDSAGLNFWTNQITSCGSDVNCIAVKRINVSAAFFLSQEFQTTGMLAYLSNKAAFGSSASGSPAPVLYGEFEREVQQLQTNLVFGQPGFDAQLEANKQAYFNDFINRPDFQDALPGTLTNAAYVDKLLTNAGITPSQTRLFVANLTNSQEVPPTTPTTSTGAARPASFGTAKFRLNAAQDAMTMTATISNIDVTGSQTADTNDNLIAAHIHAGASVAPGVNGPVVWGFFGSPFNDTTPNDATNTPTPGGVGGIFTGKWDAPEGNGTNLAAQLTNFRTGHAYINFHTTQFPGGEIRGNIPAEDAFRNSLVAGLDAATMTRAQVVRAIAESEEFSSNEFNRAFVTMEYFGYLRRDPDTAGFNFWLNKLNAFNGNFIDAEMVKAFLGSSEYRQRFGSS
jgi:uncharacterized protein (TIGR03118 family)